MSDLAPSLLSAAVAYSLPASAALRYQRTTLGSPKARPRGGDDNDKHQEWSYLSVGRRIETTHCYDRGLRSRSVRHGPAIPAPSIPASGSTCEPVQDRREPQHRSSRSLVHDWPEGTACERRLVRHRSQLDRISALASARTRAAADAWAPGRFPGGRVRGRFPRRNGGALVRPNLPTPQVSSYLWRDRQSAAARAFGKRRAAASCAAGTAAGVINRYLSIKQRGLI
jgi:hypothetical protein